MPFRLAERGRVGNWKVSCMFFFVPLVPFEYIYSGTFHAPTTRAVLVAIVSFICIGRLLIRTSPVPGIVYEYR